MTRIDGVRFDAVRLNDVLATAESAIDEKRSLRIVTPNTDVMRLLACSPTLRATVANADLVLADGMPLIWTSRLMGSPLPERVTGSSLAVRLLSLAERRGWTVAVCGARPGLARAAVQNVLGSAASSLCLTFPDAFDPQSREAEGIIEVIAQARPQVILVGLSFSKQEAFLDRLASRVSPALLLGCGMGVSYMARERQRAPAWVQGWGMEWLFRLVQEPRRLAPRYLRDAVYACRLLATAAGRGCRGG